MRFGLFYYVKKILRKKEGLYGFNGEFWNILERDFVLILRDYMSEMLM